MNITQDELVTALNTLFETYDIECDDVVIYPELIERKLFIRVRQPRLVKRQLQEKIHESQI